jgi:hypothetical protein
LLGSQHLPLHGTTLSSLLAGEQRSGLRALWCGFWHILRLDVRGMACSDRRLHSRSSCLPASSACESSPTGVLRSPGEGKHVRCFASAAIRCRARRGAELRLPCGTLRIGLYAQRLRRRTVATGDKNHANRPARLCDWHRRITLNCIWAESSRAAWSGPGQVHPGALAPGWSRCGLWGGW